MIRRRRGRAARMLGSLALAMAFRAGAQVSPADPAPAPRPPGLDTWLSTDLLHDAGLSGRFIMHVDFEPDGTAWLAASDALYMTDGYTWQRFGTGDGLPSDFVRCARVTRDGTLWVGTDRGPAVLDGLTFRPVNGPPDVPPLNIRRIVEDPDGSLWFCADRWLRPDGTAGLWHLEGDTWTRWDTADGLRTDYIQDTFFDSRGRWYVLTDEGLARWRDGRWHYEIEEAGVARSPEPFWSMAEGPEGEIVAGTTTSFYVLRDGQWSRLAHEGDQGPAKNLTRTSMGILTRTWDGPSQILQWNGEGFTPMPIPVDRDAMTEFMAQAPDGAIWSVGQNALNRWAPPDAEWTVFDHLPMPAGVDARGRPWFVDDDGAVFRDGDQWFQVPQIRGTHRARFGADGAVWSFSAFQVTRCLDGRIEEFTPPQLGLYRVTDLIAGPGDAVWVRGYAPDGRNALASFADGAWRAHAPAALFGHAISSWSIDPDSRPWLVLRRHDGSPRLVHLGPDDALVEHALPPAARHGRLVVHADRRGTLWVGGDAGLHCLEGATWREIEGMPGRSVNGPYERGDELWVVCSGVTGGHQGISHLRNGTWTHASLRVGDPIGRGTDGAIAFASSGSIYRTDDESSDGLARLHNPFPGRVHAGVPDRDGQLWLAIEDQVLRFRPDGVPPLTAAELLTPQPREGQRLRVAATGLDRFQPRRHEHHEFSWRLDGGPWSLFGEIPPHGLELPAGTGRHTLEVRARDEGGDIDPFPPQFVVEVLPIPLQARAWFAPAVALTFIALALLALSAGFARRKIRRYATDLEGIVATRTARLRQSEARLRSIFDNIPYDFWVQDERGRVILQNASARTNWGDLAGTTESPAALDGPERERWREAWRRAATGSVVTEELRSAGRGNGPARTWFVIFAPVVDDGEIIGALGIQIDITERKRTEQRQRLMMDELDHRVKNNLASVLSLVSVTDSSSTSHEEFLVNLRGRVRALAVAHEALAAGNWRGVQIDEMLRITLDLGSPGRDASITATGPPVLLPAHASGPLSMCFHELATNATRYGALATPGGRVEIRWARLDEASLVIHWTERHEGPPASVRPEGMGLRLIRGLIEFELRGECIQSFEPTGFRCTMTVPMAERTDDSSFKPDSPSRGLTPTVEPKPDAARETEQPVTGD